MLTENVIQRVARLVKIAPHLPKEMQQELHEIIKEMMVAERTEGVMPNSAIQPMLDAVPDKLMAEIVNDLRSAGQTEPGGWGGPQKPKLGEALRPYVPKDERPSYEIPERGWREPLKEERSKVQDEIFDEMVAALAGGPNDTSKLR